MTDKEDHTELNRYFDFHVQQIFLKNDHSKKEKVLATMQKRFKTYFDHQYFQKYLDKRDFDKCFQYLHPFCSLKALKEDNNVHLALISLNRLRVIQAIKENDKDRAMAIYLENTKEFLRGEEKELYLIFNLALNLNPLHTEHVKMEQAQLVDFNATFVKITSLLPNRLPLDETRFINEFTKKRKYSQTKSESNEDGDLKRRKITNVVKQQPVTNAVKQQPVITSKKTSSPKKKKVPKIVSKEPAKIVGQKIPPPAIHSVLTKPPMPRPDVQRPTPKPKPKPAVAKVAPKTKPKVIVPNQLKKVVRRSLQVCKGPVRNIISLKHGYVWVVEEHRVTSYDTPNFRKIWEEQLALDEGVEQNFFSIITESNSFMLMSLDKLQFCIYQSVKDSMPLRLKKRGNVTLPMYVDIIEFYPKNNNVLVMANRDGNVHLSRFNVFKLPLCKFETGKKNKIVQMKLIEIPGKGKGGASQEAVDCNMGVLRDDGTLQVFNVKQPDKYKMQGTMVGQYDLGLAGVKFVDKEIELRGSNIFWITTTLLVVSFGNNVYLVDTTKKTNSEVLAVHIGGSVRCAVVKENTKSHHEICVVDSNWKVTVVHCEQMLLKGMAILNAMNDKNLGLPACAQFSKELLIVGTWTGKLISCPMFQLKQSV